MCHTFNVNQSPTIGHKVPDISAKRYTRIHYNQCYVLNYNCYITFIIVYRNSPPTPHYCKYTRWVNVIVYPYALVAAFCQVFFTRSDGWLLFVSTLEWIESRFWGYMKITAICLNYYWPVKMDVQFLRPNLVIVYLSYLWSRINLKSMKSFLLDLVVFFVPRHDGSEGWCEVQSTNYKVQISDGRKNASFGDFTCSSL